MHQYTRIAVDVALVLGVMALAALAHQGLGAPVWALGPVLMIAVVGALWAVDALLPAPAHEEGS